MVFVQNLRLNQGESVIVHLVDGNNQTFDVPAGDVRAVTNVDLTQVLFTLPDTVFAGVPGTPATCNVTIKAHGQMSNTGTIRITP